MWCGSGLEGVRTSDRSIYIERLREDPFQKLPNVSIRTWESKNVELLCLPSFNTSLSLIFFEDLSRSKRNIIRMKKMEQEKEYQNFLVWFNGTNEKISHTRHLFDGWSEKSYIVVAGWGTDERFNVKLDRNNPTGDQIGGSAASGVSSDDVKRLDLVLAPLVAHIVERINKAEIDKLIVGGFSRGAAFFVPYFLQKLVRAYEMGSVRKIKKLALLLLDPVTGSKRIEDKDGNMSLSKDITDKTLEQLKLRFVKDKDQLINNLNRYVVSDIKGLYGMSFISGFDLRQERFRIDETFIEAMINNAHLGKEDNNAQRFVFRGGITHACWSTWHKDKDRTLKTIKMDGGADGDDDLLVVVLDQLRNLNFDLDKDITAELLKFLNRRGSGYDQEGQPTDALRNVMTNLVTLKGLTDVLLDNAGKINYKYKNRFWDLFWYFVDDQQNVDSETRKKVVEARRVKLNEHPHNISVLLKSWHMDNEERQSEDYPYRRMGGNRM